MSTVTASEIPQAGRREWLGLAALALPTFIVAIDIFVLLLALPALSADLGPDSNQQLWILDIYGFILAGFTVTLGTLGDRIGRRRLLLMGAAAFGLASLLCAYAPNAETLILGRALLGVAGASLMPSTLALITNLFQDPKQRAMAFGMWGGTFTLGMIIGPIIGGVLLENFWWGSVFLLALPIMFGLLIVGPKLLPEYKNGQPGRLDPLSVVLSLAMWLPVIYGIKELARNGWDVVPVLAVVLGLTSAYLFGRRQNRIPDPLLDLSLFKNRSISTTLISQLAYSVVGGGVMLFMMLYFQLVKGLSTVEAAFAMAPGMVAAIVGFTTLPRLATKIRPAILISAGMAGISVVLLGFTQVGAESSTAMLIVGFVVLSFCGSPLVSLGMNLVLGSAPPEKAGSAGSMAQMSNEFGGTLGSALLGTIGYAVYRSQVADSIPSDLPAEAAATAEDSIAGASAVASSLPDQLAAALLGPAREAFTTGLNTVAGVGAVLMAAVAVLIAVTLRDVPTIGSGGPGGPGGPEGAPGGDPTPESDATPETAKLEEIRD